VVSNELQPNDEYALSSCDILIFFVRLLHGALRRCRDAANDPNIASKTKASNSKRLLLSSSKSTSSSLADVDGLGTSSKNPCVNTVDLLMNTSIEMLYLSQFQHGPVAGRVAEAALGLIEEVGNTSNSGHLPQVIKDAILG
jgi:hypothetical protein